MAGGLQSKVALVLPFDLGQAEQLLGESGLAAQGGQLGGTLVLARPTNTFPAASTRLAVLDAGSLQVRRRVTLEGFFTVDAVSPDGRNVAVVQYGEDVLDYRVRALDTRTGQLAARDIVDPRHPDEQMGGVPLTRAVSRDGRWAYTLYGGGEETFIHALDTEGRTAACIDLDMLQPQGDLSGVRLRVRRDGKALEVRDGRNLVAAVNARTFDVVDPTDLATADAAAPVSSRRAIAASDNAGGFPWGVLALVGAAGGLCVLVIARWRLSSARSARPRAGSGPA